MTDPDAVEAADHSPLAAETDERTARADWRSSLIGTATVTILIGAWLALSPAFIDYNKPALAIVWGAVIAVIGLARLLGALGSVTLALIGAAAGALTALTALLADDTSGPTANMALMGAAVVVISLIGLAAAGEDGRRSRP
jgi:hypothetical protein